MTFPRRLVNRARRGLALFQMVLYIGLVGVLIVGAVLLYQSVTASMARDSMVRTVAQLRGGVERVYTGHGTYPAAVDMMGALHTAGAVPERIVNGSAFTEPLSQWQGGGSSYRVQSLTGLGANMPADNKSFAVMVLGLDDGDCLELVSSMIGRTDNRSGFLGAKVQDAGAGRNTGAAWSGAPDLPAPYTGTQAAGICNKGEGQNNVGLAFR